MKGDIEWVVGIGDRKEKHKMVQRKEKQRNRQRREIV
jgi:hypothetical protein